MQKLDIIKALYLLQYASFREYIKNPCNDVTEIVGFEYIFTLSSFVAVPLHSDTLRGQRLGYGQACGFIYFLLLKAFAQKLQDHIGGVRDGGIDPTLYLTKRIKQATTTECSYVVGRAFVLCPFIHMFYVVHISSLYISDFNNIQGSQ